MEGGTVSTDTGEQQINVILAALDPRLDTIPMVFCTLVEQDYAGMQDCSCRRWATICEDEGSTIILSQDEADRLGYPYTSVFNRITCRVHSSLDAVGLTAVLSSRLADAGISANVVAGYHHDHIFVPHDRAQEAVGILMSLQEGASHG